MIVSEEPQIITVFCCRWGRAMLSGNNMRGPPFRAPAIFLSLSLSLPYRFLH